MKLTNEILLKNKSFGDSPRSSGSQSASSASAIGENDQVLKVKYILLAKKLFKKEEEKRELLEQLELTQEGLQSENHNTKSEIIIFQDKFNK
ncbi:hypothetical protein DICPUDRAFT_158176 [Dictyostelium purpureum]|uniref:Uncharacterized protein n=1 Tax=Dictyostelium purpureum TaxID=5786 RepID=F1A107_DICPU|nr:uncharacterized protein DICPUDRAFT_158176 [Dictyostelium purpureum]EGC30117.1 hypothetical protein DICPUDRAFT_158176 [Dictyostelium purpureum]|eukprot:XP_003293349.1 hypothetical protein DICPUDRAFT_158176 [Dictyostelium purpureum]